MSDMDRISPGVSYPIPAYRAESSLKCARRALRTLAHCYLRPRQSCVLCEAIQSTHAASDDACTASRSCTPRNSRQTSKNRTGTGSRGEDFPQMSRDEDYGGRHKRHRHDDDDRRRFSPGALLRPCNCCAVHRRVSRTVRQQGSSDDLTRFACTCRPRLEA